ncbi:chaplin [Embleya sp. NBC_00896]|uniref:chaplin n=1 Tax=Embleya sp. NBC_00896 TaxID=2975961 RepID=UPI00386316AE
MNKIRKTVLIASLGVSLTMVGAGSAAAAGGEKPCPKPGHHSSDCNNKPMGTPDHHESGKPSKPEHQESSKPSKPGHHEEHSTPSQHSEHGNSGHGSHGNTCINRGGASAQGAAVGSPGILSGNNIQIPISIPINICGNSLNIGGLLNGAGGN